MKKKLCALAALSLAAALSLSGCKSREKVDLSGIHTSEAETLETLAPETTEAETTAAPTTKAEEETTAAPKKENETTASTALAVKSKIATEKNGKISIEYPILSNLPSSSPEKEINELIKAKATQLITAFELDPETAEVSVKCEIVSLDRNKLVATYTGSLMEEGAAHPLNLFYTTVVDLRTGELMSLFDYADPYTMAGYILSDDCTLVKTENQPEVLAELKTYDIMVLTQILENSDFRKDDTGEWPQAFSYENEGDIYMSIPVIHALGDYVLVKFSPDTK